LYLAKRIVELHGGTLSVESTAGKGTVVTAMLASRPNAAEKHVP
jgi:signal transduction histidine kinase